MSDLSDAYVLDAVMERSAEEEVASSSQMYDFTTTEKTGADRFERTAGQTFCLALHICIASMLFAFLSPAS